MHPSFTVLEKKELSEFEAEGLWLEHDATGCQVFHILKDDPENLFAFMFKTVPENSTGLPHILEHSVLSGSRQFPLKDPFVHLLKGSMNTFLNAMTYPDKTIYPASSTVKKDFFNLFHVYGDAVFFPLLKKEIFLQEGYRVAVDSEGTLSYNGVVFNEMKGSYGNHDSIAGDWSYRSLFSDSPYRFDPGGDPVVIPDLSYEEFLQFHRSCYHPSNCRIFLYGDIPTAETLDFLENKFLVHFRKSSPVEEVPDQSRWNQQVFLEKTSPVGAKESLERRSTLAINWLLTPVTDRQEVLRYEVLTEILMGNAGSPLRKALVESGIGQDLSPVSGLETDLKEMVFTVAIRGTDPEKKDDFEKMVFDTLRDLGRKGLQEDSIRGALHRVEFRSREIPGGAPFGLKLLGKCVKGWMYGKAPFSTLELTPHLETLKEELLRGTKVFETLIEKSLIDNNHRSTVLIRPDTKHNERIEAELNRRLEETQKALTEDELHELRGSYQKFKEFQTSPDSEEAVASLPALALEEIPEKVDTIETAKESMKGVPLYLHDVYANGIIYIDIAFNIADIADEDLQLLPFLTRLIPGSGTKGKPYDQVAGELAMKTGGFSASVEAGSCFGTKGTGKALFMVRLKALRSLLPDALELAGDLILETDLTDIRRTEEILKEFRNGMKARIIPRGNAFASLYAASFLSPFSRMQEQWRGITQLGTLNDLVEALPSSLSPVMEKVSNLKSRITQQSRMSVQITGDTDSLKAAKAEVKKLIERCPAGQPVNDTVTPEVISDFAFRDAPMFIPLPSPVGYAARSFPGWTLGEDGQAYQSVLAHYLATGFLWETVRMKGGAYGASSGNDAMEGVFLFNSYRDPVFPKTPSVFIEALEQMIRNPIPRDSLEKAIIGTVGKEIKPYAPAVKGLIGFKRALYGISDEARQHKRDLILSMTVDDLKDAAAWLLKQTGKGATVIMGPEEGLNSAGVDPGQVLRISVPL